MRSIGEVPSHEKTGHQNWPASYAGPSRLSSLYNSSYAGA